MVCYISCSIAVGFIIASIMTMMAKNNSFFELREKVDEQSRKEIDRIVRERMLLYVRGSLLGIILAIVFLFWAKYKFAKYTTICTFIIIMFIVQIGVYTISPKRDFILNHLKTPEQNKLWLEVYKDMKKRYHLGFIIGLVGYGVLCYAVIDSKISK
jgi:amino acid transporter